MLNERNQERLYNLLPGIYRLRDAEGGEPLRALLAVIEAEFQAIEADIGGLYDNWFIETCAEWVVPYIGDLLGVRGVGGAAGDAFSRRAYVANALRYRQRKGALGALTQVIHDATGWPTYGVEYFRRLGLAQHPQHIRPQQGRIVDVRDSAAMARLGTPFDTTARLADMRTIETGAGKYNVANLGLFVWRLQSYPVRGGVPYHTSGGRYTFHPTGHDQQLFAQPQLPTSPDTLAQEPELPIPISRLILADDLKQQQPLCRYYGSDRSLWIEADGNEVLPTQIVSCDLSGWVLPVLAPGGVAVDPVLGRLAFVDPLPQHVRTNYSYGFSGDIGAGTYDRRHALTEPTSWAREVRIDTPGELDKALHEWDQHCNAAQEPHGVLTLMDSGRYDLAASVIHVPTGGQFVIQSATGVRAALGCSAERVALHGDGSRAALTLDGLIICTTGIDLGGQLALTVRHCTLLPPPGAAPNLAIRGGASGSQVTISRSLTGPLHLSTDLDGLVVEDSIVDGGGADAISGPAASIVRTTVLGKTTVRELHASSTIFTGPVQVLLRYTGAARFCAIPSGSATPPRYRCVPDASAPQSPNSTPKFTSTDYRAPGYGQLHTDCPPAILVGGEGDAEMGAFHHLNRPQRETSLRVALEEFAPLGIEVGILYVT